MDIIIKTTKKKLSRSLVNQMNSATLDDMREGNLLGYLINVRKGEHKVLLIENNGKYSILTCGWHSPDEINGVREKYVERKGRGWQQRRKFKTVELRKEFMRLYRTAMIRAEQIYI